jgi:heat shock protein HtpX
MFELIKANKRHSIMLMLIMAVVLVILGMLMGRALAGPVGLTYGLLAACAIWLMLTVTSLSSGDQILLAASKATRVTHNVHPQLFNIVEEMSIAAGLPMPKVYIIPEPAPNAFATGRKPQTASIAVTAGLLSKLNRDELQGVIAHEMSHILHRDILFVTLAGIMLGSIVLLSQVFLRSMFWGSMGSRRRYSSSSSGGGQAQLVMLVIAIVAAILAPLFAYLLYFAISRKREYLADAGAARLTRYPEGLASALQKISTDTSPQIQSANKVTAPMFIANPFKKKNAKTLPDLTSTHPPISERIKILRKLTHGASFKNYSQTFSEITGQKSILPPSALTSEDIPLRQKSTQPEPQKTPEPKTSHRDLGDLIRKVNGFTFLSCTCGLTLKIPPNFKSKKVNCPRCGIVHKIPHP